jgi:hypothetical protein
MNERSFFKREHVNTVNFPCCFKYVLHDSVIWKTSCKTNAQPGESIHKVHKFTLNKCGESGGFLGFFRQERGGAGGKATIYREYYDYWLTTMRVRHIFVMADDACQNSGVKRL